MSVHWWRRSARKHERRLEELLRERNAIFGLPSRADRGVELTQQLAELYVPSWATHVRVRRYAGPQRGRWQVQATG